MRQVKKGALICCALALTLAAHSKFWGKSQTGETAYQQGGCAYIERCYTYSVFWVVTDSWCETELVGCQSQDY